MRGTHTLKFPGALALMIVTLTGAADAGTRSPGLTGPGVPVPPANSYAVMQG